MKTKEREDARAEAEAALKSQRDELGRLEKERGAAEAALTEATQATKDVEAEAIRRGSEIEEQVRARIAEVVGGRLRYWLRCLFCGHFLEGVRPRFVRPGAPFRTRHGRLVRPRFLR